MNIIQVEPVDVAFDSLVHELLNVEVYHAHSSGGTINQYYTDNLTEIITIAVALPSKYIAAGLDPIPPETVTAAIEKMIHIMSTVFIKGQHQVEADIAVLVKSLPVADLRTASVLRSTNMLN